MVSIEHVDDSILTTSTKMRIYIIFSSLLILLVSSVRGQPESISMAESEVGGRIMPRVEDLASILFQQAVQKDEIFSHAITILDSLKSAPSCHRLATVSLVDSCSSLERSPEGEISLAEEREKYAARLAMCELMGAKIIVPPQCNFFVPSRDGCPKPVTMLVFKHLWRRDSGDSHSSRKECFHEVSSTQVRNCLAALHDRPQWWTSYSNALQNVLVVCQASRNGVEKGKQRVFGLAGYKLKPIRHLSLVSNMVAIV
jgi:hypothetical protein